jgi:hypothetical protein
MDKNTDKKTNPEVVSEETEVKPRPEIKPMEDTTQKLPINPNMDEANKTAANVFNTQGEKAFLKHVFTDQETGRTMSYSEMRYRYG